MHTATLLNGYLAIAKKQKSAVNVLLLAPTFVKTLAAELANNPEINIFVRVLLNMMK